MMANNNFARRNGKFGDEIQQLAIAIWVSSRSSKKRG